MPVNDSAHDPAYTERSVASNESEPDATGKGQDVEQYHQNFHP